MKYKVAFVCVHNSCRSQMAEGLAINIASDLIDAYSAGTENYHEVKPLAVKVMNEIGINMDNHYPKLLEDIPSDLNIVITMGCNVSCPVIPNSYTEDWGLDDPSGGPIDDYRITRDLIKEKLVNLIERIQTNQIEF